MKSKKEIKKPEKNLFTGSDELKKTRKLKPVKKEKNPKKAFFDEIEDLEDIDLDLATDDFDEEEIFDDEEEEDY
jgi:hypothetical protein